MRIFASITIQSRAVYAALFCCIVLLVHSVGAYALEKKPLTIVTSTGRHLITVEVASNAQEQAFGLMFRRSLAPDAGMIFLFPNDKEITMWMKNTFIPLDMIFVTHDGIVSRIEENTEPMSERVISSGSPARVVIEMTGGSAARLGIKPGDKIEYPDLK